MATAQLLHQLCHLQQGEPLIFLGIAGGNQQQMSAVQLTNGTAGGSLPAKEGLKCLQSGIQNHLPIQEQERPCP
jgi:hypothetical protein